MLALTLLAGCWPYIPGAWTDYAVPDASRVVGQVSWTTYLGGYFTDNTPTGLAYWGWMDTPTTMTAWELGTPDSGCVLNSGDTSWFYDNLAAVDEDTSELSGNPAIELAFTRSVGAMVADPTDEPKGTYGLEPFHVGGTAYAGDDVLEMPSKLDYETTLYNGSAPQTVTASTVSDFTWTTPIDPEGLYAVVTVYVVTSGGRVSDYVTCAAPAEDGALTMDFSDLSDFASASYVVVEMGVAQQTEALLDGSDNAVRFLGVRSEEGAVYIQ